MGSLQIDAPRRVAPVRTADVRRDATRGYTARRGAKRRDTLRRDRKSAVRCKTSSLTRYGYKSEPANNRYNRIGLCMVNHGHERCGAIEVTTGVLTEQFGRHAAIQFNTPSPEYVISGEISGVRT